MSQIIQLEFGSIKIKLQVDSKISKLVDEDCKMLFDRKYNYCCFIKTIGNVSSNIGTLVCCGKINKKDKTINYIENNNEIPDNSWKELGFEDKPENSIN